MTDATARECLDTGVGHIPEDRQVRGLVLDFTLAENLALHDFPEADSKWGWLYPAPPDPARRSAPEGVRRPRGTPGPSPRHCSAATNRRS